MKRLLLLIVLLLLSSFKDTKFQESENITIASWYGGFHHGRLTASGEVFNQNLLTAAHKTLPFGTKLEVTNLNNGKSVVVEINDRGPFIKGRGLDLSREAFKRISPLSKGIIKVSYKIVE